MWRNRRRRATAGHGQGGRKEGRKAIHQQRLQARVLVFRGLELYCHIESGSAPSAESASGFKTSSDRNSSG